MSSNQTPDARAAAIEAGEALLALVRLHVDLIKSEKDIDDAAEEIDRDLWDAVAAYGDALDELYEEEDEDDDEDDEPKELTFSVRTRYDYTVIDEKAFLAAGTGIGGAVEALLQSAGGRVLPALEVDSLETGCGLITVHLNEELLEVADFEGAEEPTDLLLVDPDESLQWVLNEPVYGSRAEAEAAARDAGTTAE